MTTDISRRSVLTGAAVLGAAATAGILGRPLAVQADEAAAALADTPDRTLEADVVVVGGGISGLSAAVEASELGAQVVLLEKLDQTGGWGRGTEGVAGVGTSFQEDQGVDVRPVDVIRCEADYMHGRIDNLLWVDIIDNSRDNFEWMVSKGVRFSGVVDDYLGSGNGLNTFHWFETGTAASSYSEPMAAAAEAQGVQILTNTRGLKLALDGNAVAGIYALEADGSTLLVKAPAVILATGGVAGNRDYVAHCNLNMDTVVQLYPEMTGDGLSMALEVGANDILGSVSALEVTAIGDQPSGSYATYTRNGTGPAVINANTLWVNGKGERFTAEDAGSDNWMATQSAIKTQRTSYSFLNQERLDANMASRYSDDPDKLAEYMADFDAMVEEGGRGAIKASTIDELVELAANTFEGIDATALRTSIDSYGQMCAAGEDTFFGKPAEYLVAMEEGPFYLVRHLQTVCVTFGAVRTDRSFQVLNKDHRAIPGLYAIGVDGVMLWPNIYTINVPGGANASNVNSGRTAARAAWAYLGN